MPLYEYLCSNCGHQVEYLEKVQDEPRRHCPACEQNSLQRKISASNFKLKGKGWYATDFKDKNKSDTKNNETAKNQDNSQPKDKKHEKTNEKSPKQTTKVEKKNKDA